MSDDGAGPGNFIRDRIQEDLATGRRTRVVTRFPPEPNGYLHIGHATAVVLNFGLAEEFGGVCNLRFDDTNPEVEEVEYVEAIEEDVRWLGYEWNGESRYASDYFPQLFAWARSMVEKGQAYVDSQDADAIRRNRGDYHTPGVDSPYRSRSVEENLALLDGMKRGDFEEGEHVLRAKIDMASKDLKLRDPLMYRIRKVPHHRTGDEWCIYPMYDWAHGQSDAIEGITHSICTLEFVNHHALYDWFLSTLEIADPPEQIERAKTQLTFIVLSKRRLRRLVEEGYVDGWDDPRMPTIAGLRRRGFTPESLRAWAENLGVTRSDSVTDIGHLEYAIRDDLDRRAPRVMAVLEPLKITLTNFPEDRVEWFDVPHHPRDESFGTRRVPLTREVFVERSDFMEDPPKKWFRLAPGREVRLRNAALITCDDVVRDDAGEVVELRCTWDPASSGGNAPDGRKVRGTLHWVSAAHAVDAEVRLYDRMVKVENPFADDSVDFVEHLNPESLVLRPNAKLEPSLADAQPGHRVQFERLGYFCADTKDHVPGERPVWNRTIGLKDGWAKLVARGATGGRGKPRQGRGGEGKRREGEPKKGR
jgi:glutaminyl-tRNA synthetase